MPNFCRYCGAKLRHPGASFCTTCGRPLQADDGRTELLDTNIPELIVEEPGKAPRSIPLAKPQLTIGRAAGNDIVIQNPVVSRQHAQVEQRAAHYWISDLDSTNGVAVNGKRIAHRQELSSGDIIRIGDPQGNSISLTLRSSEARFEGNTSTFIGKHGLGHAATVVIGRDPSSDLVLDHPTVSRRHAQVEQTAQGHDIRDLNSINGTFVNGQAVRRPQLLQVGDVVQIGPFKLAYDRTGLSQYAPAGNYRLDAIRLSRRVPLLGPFSPQRLLGLNGRPTHRLILDDISLSVYPREFVALVGGSGAGKSTLMKALSGFAPAQGQILVNGDDLYANFAAYRSILGYVPQDDVIHDHLSVRSALTYAARLRLSDAGADETERRISGVLEQVEMTEHAGKQVSTLSGGQRKRVSIAVELLAEPGLFFLDEPTSGLDPGLEKKMMYTLRRLADAGRTIVLVTHATANITQCTHLAFLAEGRLAFYGPPQEALAFFGVEDFPDIYTRLSQPIDPARNPLPPHLQQNRQQMQASQSGRAPTAAEVWSAAFRNSPQWQRYVIGRLQTASAAPEPATVGPQLARQRVSALRQFGILTQRYLDLIRRDTMSLLILLLVMPLIGILLLIISGRHDLVGKNQNAIQTQIQQAIDDKRAEHNPDRDDERFQASYGVADKAQQLLFVMALSANLLGLFAAAFEIVKEQSIYARERMVNLGIVPYLLSKMAVLGLFAALQCLLLLLVVRLKVKYPPKGVFLPAPIEMYVTMLLATLASTSMGLLISALVRSTNTVIYVILFVLFVQIIFAGAAFELPPLAEPVSYLTTTRWTLEALGSTANMEALSDKGVSCVEFEDEMIRRGMGEPEAPCETGQMRQPVKFPFYVVYEHTT